MPQPGAHHQPALPQMVRVTVLGMDGRELVDQTVPNGTSIGKFKEIMAGSLGCQAKDVRLFHDAEELDDAEIFSPEESGPPLEEVLLSALIELPPPPAAPSDVALLDAAKSGDDNQVRAVLQAAGDCRALLLKGDGQGCTPLHHACQKGHAEIVSQLLGRDHASPVGSAVRRDLLTAINDYDDTALHFAAIAGHAAVAQTLIDTSIDEGMQKELLRERNPHGDTALHVVAGHDAVAQVLLYAAASEGLRSELIAARNDDGDTALHVAAGVGSSHVVDTLVDAADQEGMRKELLLACNDNRTTGLHIACSHGHAEVARSLAAAADQEGVQDLLLAAQDCMNQTALEIAQAQGASKVLQALKGQR